MSGANGPWHLPVEEGWRDHVSGCAASQNLVANGSFYKFKTWSLTEVEVRESLSGKGHRSARRLFICRLPLTADAPFPQPPALTLRSEYARGSTGTPTALVVPQWSREQAHRVSNELYKVRCLPGFYH